MKSLHRILKCQSHFLKAIIFTFLISANASLIPLSAEEFIEPGYHCKKKIYSFRVIEETREAACHGLISIYETARRPRVYIHNNNFEDYIYEWSIPVSKSRDSEVKEDLLKKFLLIIDVNSKMCFTTTVQHINMSRVKKYPMFQQVQALRWKKSRLTLSFIADRYLGKLKKFNWAQIVIYRNS